MERSPAPAARVMLLACLLLALMGTAPRIPTPAQAQEECKPWKWFVYHTCAAPGAWCHLAIARKYVEGMNQEGMTVLASYRTEAEALRATCGAMSERYSTGEGAVYPGVKAKVGADMYDVGAFVTYGDGSWPCRDPEPDEDSDGVPDGVPNFYGDRCPGTPAGTAVDMSGCPCNEGDDCAEQCKVFGTHALGEVKDGTCFCRCEFGYEGDQTGTCVISKARCNQACREYHGTDKNHGPQAYGTVDDGVCNCHCAEGYAPDETLTCVKQESCQEVCRKERGEGATGRGNPPNCTCGCQPDFMPMQVYDEGWKVVCVKKVCPPNSSPDKTTGKCICREGFHPEPVDGICIKKIDDQRCGNKTCNTEQGDGLLIEDCHSCPPDCVCPTGTTCNSSHPDATIENWGCVRVAARIIGVGCRGIYDTPIVLVQRAGARPQEAFDAEVGLNLSKGDKVTLFRKGLKTGQNCKDPYLTLQWGTTIGRVYLGDALYHDLTIGETAVDSGWPVWQDAAPGGIRLGMNWGLKWVIKKALGAAAKAVTGPVISVLLSPSRTAGDAVKVYAKSHLVIWQTPAEVVVHTLEGEAQVDDGNRLVTVGEGMKATVREGATGDPVAFDPDEIPEMYRADPIALQSELEGPAPEAAPDAAEGSPAALTGIAGWAMPAACVGLLTVLLAGGALVVWQRSRWGGRRQPAPAGRGTAAPGLSTRAPQAQGTQRGQDPPAASHPAGWGSLSVREGPAPARTVTLQGPALTIGRSSNNDLALRDGLISRQHAQIRRQTGGAVLHDLGSTNGTFLNGQRIGSPQSLRPGDVIHVGHTELVFEPGAPHHSGAPHHPQPAQASRVSLVLHRPVLTIGRSSSCDLVLMDRGISRCHAEIRRQGGGAVLTDLGSANGTYVNGRRVLGSCAVQPGDIIRVGNTELVVKARGVEHR